MIEKEAQIAEHEFRSHVKFEDHSDYHNHLEFKDGCDNRISSQLEFMQENLAKLSAVFFELQKRIDQILIPEIDENESIPGTQPRNPASKLSYTIDDLNSQIGNIQKRIALTTERVQL